MQWKRMQYGTLQGYVGSLQLFTISKSVTRQPGGADLVLRTTLPGFSKAAGKQMWPSEESAKKEAERLLRSFLHYVEAHAEEVQNAEF